MPVNGKYPDIRHLVIKNKSLPTNLQLEMLSVVSDVYWILFGKASICFHAAIVHARIISNDIILWAPII